MTVQSQTAVIYARYSSHAQRDVSIEQQIRACRQFADRSGFTVVDTYEDHALTGRSDQRPAFQRMIHDAAKASWEYVIVYSLDRFARDRYDSAVYKRQLRNNGVRVLSAMENINDDPTGVLMEGMLESLAEYYSRDLGAKVKRGMADNARRCMVNGYLPLGYVKGPDGRYAIQEDEAEIVRSIYKRVSDGERIVDIIEDLNHRGIKTKRGKPWTKSSFNKMLSNERYVGTYIFGDIRTPGGIPAIVSQDLFDRVQYAVTTKSQPRSLGPQRRRRENGLYMLTGKLFCGHCHEPMVGISGTGKGGQIYNYYACRGKLHKTCSMGNVSRDLIECQVATALRDTMLTDSAICDLADATVAYQQNQLDQSDIGPLTAQLQEVERGINNLVKALEMGIFSASTQARLQELEHEQRVLSGQLAAAQEEAQTFLTREELIAALSIFQDGDVHDKNFQQSLFDTFLVAAYVYPDRLKIVFHLNKDEQFTELPFEIANVSNPDTSPQNVCIEDSEGDHIALYETFGCTVYMIHGLFVFQCKR